MFLKMGGVELFCLMMIVLAAVSAQECIYNGRKHRAGAKLTNICTDMTCVSGKWNTTGIFNKMCAVCRIGGNSHIETFDQYSYEWHRGCNYSIAQLNFGFNEKFGIYGHSSVCSDDSCIYKMTFTDNPNTIIEINQASLETISVNGEPCTVTDTVDGVPVGTASLLVLVWKLEDCIMILGSQGLMLMVCPTQIYVWAHTNLRTKLNGLCGRYSSVQTDDFTDRINNAHPLQKYPEAFPESWKTAQQSNSSCVPGDACQGNEETREKKIDDCKTLLKDVKWEKNSPSASTLQQAISDCATELCKLGEGDTPSDDLTNMMKTMLEHDIMVEVKTKDIRG